MDVLLIRGEGPSKELITEKIDSSGRLSGVVVQQRGDAGRRGGHIQSERNRRLNERYTTELEPAREELFPKRPYETEQPVVNIQRGELNTEHLYEFARDIDPDLTITYGIEILSRTSLKKIPGDVWNIHNGLAPVYRGVRNLFWPSYMLEPQMTGITVHEVTEEVDAGPIVHQFSGRLLREDGLCELMCRTVSEFVREELVRLLDIYEKHEYDTKPQISAGKMWYSDDFHPSHLSHIYDTHDDRINAKYLDGELTTANEPDLYRQF